MIRPLFYMIINIDNRIPSTLLRILIKMIIGAFSIIEKIVWASK